MPHDCITDPKALLRELGAFGEKLRERRRFERQELHWTATVEVRGQRFEGVVTDLSPGGARIKFEAAVQKGDELRLVLRQLNELGAKVVWQRQGEAGLSFVLAPEEVAARLKGKVLPFRSEPASQPSARAATEEPPAAADAPADAPPRSKRLLVALAAAGTAILALLALGSLFIQPPAEAPTVLALNGGASDQHDCSVLLGKITGANNQVDFSLRMASAAQAKCLDLLHIDQSYNDMNAHMTHATKVPLH
ncbi:MAG TPA: PilZ domain-containing protein [Stellaceae bacterium]|nr:PilZ domain-containing protein [Stellaceae bacterium]